MVLPELADFPMPSIFPSPTHALTFHLHVTDRSRCPSGYCDPGVSGSPEHFAGTRMCHVHSPRKGRRDTQGWGRVRSVQDARQCLEGSDIVGKRWAEPRSLCGPHGGGSPRLTRTQAASGTRRIGIRTSRNRSHTDKPSRLMVAGVFVVRHVLPAGVQSFALRIERQRSNAAMPSSTVTRSITSSCSILVPHLSSLAGLPRYFRAASS